MMNFDNFFRFFSKVWPWIREQGYASVLLLVFVLWLIFGLTPRIEKSLNRVCEEFRADQQRDHLLLIELINREFADSEWLTSSE